MSPVVWNVHTGSGAKRAHVLVRVGSSLRSATLLLMLTLLVGLSTHRPSRWTEAGRSVAVPLDAMRVTQGELTPLSEFEARASSALVQLQAPALSGAYVELDFVYRGAGPVASDPREQIGLELSAADSCSRVEIMWRNKPAQGLFVTQRAPDGCAGVRPAFIPVWQRVHDFALEPGKRHVLSARLHDSELEISADGLSVWRGRVRADSLDADGPVGVRAENVDAEFSLKGSPAADSCEGMAHASGSRRTYAN